MHGRGGGSERRDRVFDAVLRQRYDIHVPLDHHHPAGVANGIAREIKPIQLTALGKHRRFRRIQIFGFAGAKHPPAEADHAAPAVMDREHHAIAEPVVPLAAVTADHETCRLERRIVVIRKDLGQALPGVRRVTYAEAGGDLAREAPRFEIFDCMRGLLQAGSVEARRCEQQFIEILRFLAAFLVAGVFDPGHFEAAIAGQFLHGIRKRLAGMLHQEADGGAVRAASEAVIELLGRTDGERRCLFAVERAAGDVVGAGLLQRDMAVDDLDDIHAGK